MKSRRSWLLLFGLAPSLTAPLVPAGEVPWVKAPPSIGELTNGAVKVGDRITAQNLEAVKHLLPQGMDRILRDGNELIVAETSAPERFIAPALRDATLKNAHQQVIDPDGTLSAKGGGPWPGGFPVLEPKSGLEVMVNSQFQLADTLYDPIGVIHWTNPEGQVYRVTYGSLFSDRSTSRVCVDPKPTVAGREQEDRRELFRIVDPYDVRGIAILTFLYRDQKRLPDTWGYVPVLRRVQRLSTAQRYDSVDGSDIRLGDINVFNDPLGIWEYKTFNRAPLLSLVGLKTHPRRASRDDKAIPRVNGKLPVNTQTEVRDTFVVEAIPKDPTHIYSKKVLYIDSTSYIVWYGAAYDRQGELWMAHIFPQDSEETPCGPSTRILSGNFYNLQKGGGTFVDVVRQSYVGSDLVGANMFTLKFLAAQAR